MLHIVIYNRRGPLCLENHHFSGYLVPISIAFSNECISIKGGIYQSICEVCILWIIALTLNKHTTTNIFWAPMISQALRIKQTGRRPGSTSKEMQPPWRRMYTKPRFNATGGKRGSALPGRAGVPGTDSKPWTCSGGNEIKDWHFTEAHTAIFVFTDTLLLPSVGAYIFQTISGHCLSPSHHTRNRDGYYCLNVGTKRWHFLPITDNF